MDGEACPRCGGPVHWSGRGRRARWCSQACRRAAYEERRAAATGAIAVRVVERETTREPTPTECVARVLTSPGRAEKSSTASPPSPQTGNWTPEPTPPPSLPSDDSCTLSPATRAGDHRMPGPAWRRIDPEPPTMRKPCTVNGTAPRVSEARCNTIQGRMPTARREHQ